MNLIPDTEAAKSFLWLTDHIPTGRKNGVSMDQLRKILSMDDIKLKYRIMDARLAGILICSGNNGYYFPQDEMELRDFISKREGYIRTADTAMNAFRDALQEKKDGI